MRFKFDGNEYDLVERPLFAEGAWVEDQAKRGLDDMYGSTRMAALVLISLRRAGVMLTWPEMMQLEMTSIEVIPGEAPAEPDPQTPGADGEAAGGDSVTEPTAIGSFS